MASDELQTKGTPRGLFTQLSSTADYSFLTTLATLPERFQVESISTLSRSF